jgi:hypothetical protein
MGNDLISGTNMNDNGISHKLVMLLSRLAAAARGKVLFMGASGSQRNMPIRGRESPIFSDLRVHYAGAEDKNTLGKQPAALSVDRVDEYGNLALWGIKV